MVWDLCAVLYRRGVSVFSINVRWTMLFLFWSRFSHCCVLTFISLVVCYLTGCQYLHPLALPFSSASLKPTHAETFTESAVINGPVLTETSESICNRAGSCYVSFFLLFYERRDLDTHWSHMWSSQDDALTNNTLQLHLWTHCNAVSVKPQLPVTDTVHICGKKMGTNKERPLKISIQPYLDWEYSLRA